MERRQRLKIDYWLIDSFLLIGRPVGQCVVLLTRSSNSRLIKSIKRKRDLRVIKETVLQNRHLHSLRNFWRHSFQGWFSTSTKKPMRNINQEYFNLNLHYGERTAPISFYLLNTNHKWDSVVALGTRIFTWHAEIQHNTAIQQPASPPLSWSTKSCGKIERWRKKEEWR